MNMNFHYVQYNGYIAIVDSFEEPVAIIHDGEGKLDFCRKLNDKVKKEVEKYAISKKLI